MVKYITFLLNSPADGDIWLLLKITGFNSIFVLTLLLKSVAQNEKLMAKNEEIRRGTPLAIVFLLFFYLQENTLFFNMK